MSYELKITRKTVEMIHDASTQRWQRATADQWDYRLTDNRDGRVIKTSVVSNEYVQRLLQDAVIEQLSI